MNVKITPGKLTGTLQAPLSKSHAHRFLIAQKLARLQGNGNESASDVPSFSQDIEATKNCLVQLDKKKPFLDCWESGSTLRFMLPVAMALKKEAVFLGTGQLPYRPISPLKEEMELHGCSFTMKNSPPKAGNRHMEICTVRGRLTSGSYRLAGNISSQFITGLLMALPLLDGDSNLELTTALESAGYVDLTLDVLRDFGIKVNIETSSQGFYIYEIPGNQQYIEPARTTIQCDWSNAAFWLACGALGGDITLTGLELSSSQRDKQIVHILEEMGAHITIGDISIRCHGASLLPAEVDVSQIPDLVPVLAAIMSLADGTSMISNAERLRLKESDRLRTVFDFLSRLGADITDGGSGLSITGQPSLSGGTVYGHNDHRIVMAAAVASCGCNAPVIIRGADAVAKSYPEFFDDFTALGGNVQEV